jgi:MATE family multidrug resistance protein
MVKMMTSDVAVIDAAKDYLPWLLLMPIVGCAAFTWDGIYIGATASRQMRNSMLWAVVAFVVVWAVGVLGFNMGLHGLMAAYFAHLLARTIYLSVDWTTKRNTKLF